MFNMATGSGKTFLMGALILYYYKKGYRNFIFFVHRSNIVNKTENNFIDKNHTKYLFKDKIIIDDKVVNIRKVEKFSNISNNIEIKFTTIQKLYNDIHDFFGAHIPNASEAELRRSAVNSKSQNPSHP